MQSRLGGGPTALGALLSEIQGSSDGFTGSMSVALVSFS